MDIRAYRPDDLNAVVSLWNGCVKRGEVLYRPLKETYFEEKFVRQPGAEIFVACEGEGLLGLLVGCRKTEFLPGQTEENTPAYLSVMMVDRAHRRCGVGSYFAGWDRIEAEWYMAIPEGVNKIELKTPDGTHAGFAVAQTEGTSDVSYPHVYDIRTGSTMTLHAKGSGIIEVLADGKSLGTAAVDSADFADVCVPLGDLAGEHDITLRLRGCITLDWFTLK